MSLFSTAGVSRASGKHPLRVIGAWILILVLAGVISSQWLGDVLTTEINFVDEPESVQGVNLIADRMGLEDPISETVIVHSDTLTVDDEAFAATVNQVVANLRGLPELVDLDSGVLVNYYEIREIPEAQAGAEQLVSGDRSTLLVPVAFIGSLDEVDRQFDAYHDAITVSATEAVEVLSVGDLTINHEFNHIAEEDLVRAEMIGIPIALIILIVVFGALVAAIVPIGLALISIAVALGLVTIAGQFGSLSFFITNMVTLIGLAVGIDYALFIVERYREERRRGRSKLDAIEVTGGTASKAVLFSGLTVVFALVGLFLVPTSIFRSLGLGAILVVLVAVAAMLTLVPALLSLLGDRIDWPRRRNYNVTVVRSQAEHDREMIHNGFWGRLTKLVMARPWPAVIIGGGLLVALSLPYFSLNTGFAGVETLPESEARDAFMLLDEQFAAGRLAPVDVVIDASRSPEVDSAIVALSEAMAAEADFAVVEPPVWNEANDLALVRGTLQANPNDPEAYRIVVDLREETIPSLFAGTGASVYVSGDTAFNEDFFELVDRWTPIVFLFVLGLSFILLTLVFRSLVVPTTAIIMNLLSVGAAYGLLVLVFQEGYLVDFFGFQQTPMIEAWIPIFLFAVLFGLSMDYQVFLLSRIREHYDLTKRNTESVAVGLQSTAKIITGAALIMVAVFAGFASGRLVMLQQVGFGLAIAVLIDATIIRSILVPATMRLLGDWNWYLPKWLHWLPNVSVEGQPLAMPEANPAD
jgi:putative drug exporter of the RND superfamily